MRGCQYGSISLTNRAKAGLFSAVVTAFIIESYQTLQLDSNDQIISLLSRIADQMNTPIGNTSSGAAFPTNLGFTPSPSNLRVNIFWFISLVLSLAVALIGIIALQWLREHQRYEPGMTPTRSLAIFNARSDGLKRWYIPQIFAGLPLLLQAALVLFFIGLADFLFAICIDVAIPVAVAVAIPILFLLVTTVLPTLQLYAMHLPYFLRVNDRAPAPCPYKSPQALIFQRAAISSATLFNLFARAFSAVWIPFVVIIRLFVSSDKPFYGKLAPFSTNDYHYQVFLNRLRSDAGNWMAMDSEWLSARTSYAVAIHTPINVRNLRWPYASNRELADAVVFYDFVQAMKHIASNCDSTDRDYMLYLHSWMRHTISTITQGLHHQIEASYSDAEHGKAVQVHITALLSIIGSYGHQQTKRLVEGSGGQTGLVYEAFYAILADQAFCHDFDFDHENIEYRLETHMNMIHMHLSDNAHALFLCSNLPGITPSLSLSTRRSLSYHRDSLEQTNPGWMERK